MKKLTLIIPTLGGGGAERVASYISNFLDLEEFTLSVIYFYETDNKYQFNTSCTCLNLSYVSKFQVLKRFKRFILTYRRLLNIKKKKESDIYISFLSEANVFNILTKTRKSKTILTEHNYLRISFSFSNFVNNVFRLTLFRIADKIVCVSDGILEQYRSMFYSKKKLLRIYNGIDLKFVDNFHIGNKPDTLHLITIGRINNQKSQWILITAFKEILSFIPNAKLTILGKGKKENDLKLLIEKLGISESVDMLGFVDNPYDYLNSASIFLLTSQFEGFGMVLLEAMALGIPVIATDCKYGPSEILSSPGADNGYPLLCEYGYLVKGLISSNNIERSINLNAETINQIIDIVKLLNINKKHYNEIKDKSLNRVKDFDLSIAQSDWIRLIYSL